MKILIVGGPPRSGTRFVTDALNTHPDVNLTGEIPERHVLPAMLDAGAALRRAHDAEGRTEEEWAAIGPVLLVHLAATLRKKQLGQVRPSRAFQGFKSPRIELRWREIADMVGPLSFVFCLRPFADHYLSCVNRWPAHKMQRLARLYLQSVQAAESMMEGDSIELVAFSLPDMARDGSLHLAAIGERLGLNDAEAWAKTIDPERKANRAEKFTDVKRTELSQEETAFIAGRPELQAAHDGFWERYQASR